MSWFSELQWDSEEQNYWKCLIENQGGSFNMSYYNQTQVSELSEMNMNYQNRTISKGSVFTYLDMTSLRHFCEADNYLLLGNGTVTAACLHYGCMPSLYASVPTLEGCRKRLHIPLLIFIASSDVKNCFQGCFVAVWGINFLWQVLRLLAWRIPH